MSPATPPTTTRRPASPASRRRASPAAHEAPRLLGLPYEDLIDYSRAVRDGRHVSGTTGFDYATMTIDPDPAAQTDQALRSIERALAEAGARIAGVRCILPHPAAIRSSIGPRDGSRSRAASTRFQPRSGAARVGGNEPQGDNR